MTEQQEPPKETPKERRTLLEIFARKYPHIHKWQWYISVALDIGFYILLIYMFFAVRESSVIFGINELNKTCESCLTNCHQYILNMSKTTLTLIQ